MCSGFTSYSETDMCISELSRSFGVFRSRVKFGDSTTTAISVVLVYMHST